MSNNSPIVLLLTQQSDMAAELGLPNNDDNLFQRIIRNPHIEAANPRERECTEMLCAVLRNTNVLRLHLLRWMADLAGVTIDRFDDLRFIIDTEGAIGNKRDDLRIEGWQETDGNRQRVFVWTVEVKVSASFHYSAPLYGDAVPVNQIENYDGWLANQSVPHRAGFVLALKDMSDSLPPNLSCSWWCFSWTKLGLKLQDALRDQLLPEKEKFLAKHLLGFITNHLWRDSEMADFELNFDDVALVRAFAAIGRDCEDNINRLVESLVAVVKDSDIGHGEITTSKTLFKQMQRSVVRRDIFEPNICKYPTLWAGISGAYMTIWLDTVTSYRKRSIIESVVHSLLPSLKERNPAWSEGELSYQVLELRMPLANLLGAADQTSAFKGFFIAALEDLRETGVIELLRDRLVD